MSVIFCLFLLSLPSACSFDASEVRAFFFFFEAFAKPSLFNNFKKTQLFPGGSPLPAALVFLSVRRRATSRHTSTRPCRVLSPASRWRDARPARPRPRRGVSRIGFLCSSLLVEKEKEKRERKKNEDRGRGPLELLSRLLSITARRQRSQACLQKEKNVAMRSAKGAIRGL